MVEKTQIMPNFENVHWADNSAQRVIDEFPNEESYTVASGITPSGIIHVGHFREIITSELVRRALEHKGKKTKFIYSWDSYDAFRKVPKNIPEEWSKYLRLPDGKVPDPWGCHESFGEHWMQSAEDSLKTFNFPINFQRQHLLQTSGIYAEGIKNYISQRDKARNLINKHRPEDRPLLEDWFPMDVFCEKCGKDTTKISNYDEKYTLDYKCECGHKNTINFKENPIVKLVWRLDWPMRWNHYKITFEPGGKDHSTPGGSYDTGCDIIREISNRKPPVYTFYNFVSMKGMNGKISSSSGTGATIADVLQIYTPELVIFLFAGTRPNAEFDISFDIDVIKIYEDFDKLERVYYGLDVEENPKKLATLKRTYELSLVKNLTPQKEIPYQPSFRLLTTVMQANDFDYEKVQNYYAEFLKTDFDINRLKERFEAAKNWLEIYAPEEMKFSINKELRVLNKKEKEIVKTLLTELDKTNDPKELFGRFKNIAEDNEITVKEFFELFYDLIIGKEKGPKLAEFLIQNKDKITALLNQN